MTKINRRPLNAIPRMSRVFTNISINQALDFIETVFRTRFVYRYEWLQLTGDIILCG